MDMRKAIDLSESAIGTGMVRTFAILNLMVEKGAIGRYALCGAMAAFEYIEAVATRDIDLTVELPGAGLLLNFKSITDFLEEHFLPVLWDDEGLLIGSYPVQFIPPSSQLDRDALNDALVVTSGGLQINIWRVEHLMAKCLETYRPKDRERLSRFLDEAKFNTLGFCQNVKTYGLSDRWVDFLTKTGRDDVCEHAT